MKTRGGGAGHLFSYRAKVLIGNHRRHTQWPAQVVERNARRAKYGLLTKTVKTLRFFYAKRAKKNDVKTKINSG